MAILMAPAHPYITSMKSIIVLYGGAAYHIVHWRFYPRSNIKPSQLMDNNRSLYCQVECEFKYDAPNGKCWWVGPFYHLAMIMVWMVKHRRCMNAFYFVITWSQAQLSVGLHNPQVLKFNSLLQRRLSNLFFWKTFFNNK